MSRAPCNISNVLYGLAGNANVYIMFPHLDEMNESVLRYYTRILCFGILEEGQVFLTCGDLNMARTAKMEDPEFTGFVSVGSALARNIWQKYPDHVDFHEPLPEVFRDAFFFYELHSSDDSFVVQHPCSGQATFDMVKDATRDLDPTCFNSDRTNIYVDMLLEYKSRKLVMLPKRSRLCHVAEQMIGSPQSLQEGRINEVRFRQVSLTNETASVSFLPESSPCGATFASITSLDKQIEAVLVRSGVGRLHPAEILEGRCISQLEIDRRVETLLSCVNTRNHGCTTFLQRVPIMHAGDCFSGAPRFDLDDFMIDYYSDIMYVSIIYMHFFSIDLFTGDL